MPSPLALHTPLFSLHFTLCKSAASDKRRAERWDWLSAARRLSQRPPDLWPPRETTLTAKCCHSSATASYQHNHCNTEEEPKNIRTVHTSVTFFKKIQVYCIIWSFSTWGRYRQQVHIAHSLVNFNGGELISLITVHPGGKSIQGQICVQAQSFKCRLE